MTFPDLPAYVFDGERHELAYIKLAETWFNAEEKLSGYRHPPTLEVRMMRPRQGGDRWVFHIQEDHYNSDQIISVKVRHTDFAVYEEFAEFFVLLATAEPDTLGEIEALLKDLGATDITAYDRPF